MPNFFTPLLMICTAPGEKPAGGDHRLHNGRRDDAGCDAGAVPGWPGAGAIPWLAMGRSPVGTGGGEWLVRRSAGASRRRISNLAGGVHWQSPRRRGQCRSGCLLETTGKLLQPTTAARLLQPGAIFKSAGEPTSGGKP